MDDMDMDMDMDIDMVGCIEYVLKFVYVIVTY